MLSKAKTLFAETFSPFFGESDGASVSSKSSELETEIELQPRLDSSSNSSIQVGVIAIAENSPDEAHVPQNSINMSTFLVVNTMIGSGILNQPEVFMKSGVFGALLGYAIGAYCIWLGLILLANSAEKGGIRDYVALSKSVYGESFGKLVILNISLNNFGALMSYITVIGATASDLMVNWGCDSGGCTTSSMIGIIITTVVFPICLRRHYGHMAFLSVFSIFTIVSVVLFVIIGGQVHTQNDRKESVNLLNIAGIFEKFGSIVFALSCASASLDAFSSMKEPTLDNCSLVFSRSVILGCVLLIVMGISGYLAFREDTEGEILENFSTHDADFFKIMLIMHLIFYIPIDFIIMRFNVQKLFSWPAELPYLYHFMLCAFMLSLTVLLVLLLDYLGLSKGRAFGLILDLTGSICASMTSFVIPSILYMKVHGSSGSLLLHSKILLAFGLFVMVAVPTSIAIHA